MLKNVIQRFCIWLTIGFFFSSLLLAFDIIKPPLRPMVLWVSFIIEFICFFLILERKICKNPIYSFLIRCLFSFFSLFFFLIALGLLLFCFTGVDGWKDDTIWKSNKGKRPPGDPLDTAVQTTFAFCVAAKHEGSNVVRSSWFVIFGRGAPTRPADNQAD